MQRETPLGAFPASSPMVAVQGQGKQSLVLQCGGRWDVRKGGKGVADPTGVPECRPTVFSGLTARDRGLGTGILAHEAVGSPGGSRLPPPVIHTPPPLTALPVCNKAAIIS